MMKYLFVSTSAIYSGHEKLFFKAATNISHHTKSVFIINKKNTQGLTEIKLNGNFSDVIQIDFGKDYIESIRVWFRWLLLYKLVKIFKKINPDKIIVGQGRIEGGAIAVLASRIAFIRCVSYLPMAHSHKVMSGDCLKSSIKDVLSNQLYKLPSEYIVISDAVKKDLRKHTCKKISVVENYTSLSNLVKPTGISTNISNSVSTNILVLGRISFRHKCQNEVVRSVYNNSELYRERNIKINIVGDGPDMLELQNMIVLHNLSHIINVCGYTEDVSSIINNTDVLFIPSRYEGVPLTMLEAARRGIFILGRDIPGIKEYIHTDFLFNSVDEGLLKITELVNDDLEKNYMESLLNLLIRTEDDFCNDFKLKVE